MTIFEFVKDQFLHNQFATAAVLAAPVAAASYSLRKIPEVLFGWTKSRSFTTLEITSSTESYNEFIEFLSHQVIKNKFSRSYTVRRDYSNQTGTVWYRNEGSRRIYTDIQLGYGIHFGIYKRIPVVVYRFLEKKDSSTTFRESTSVKFLTRKNHVLLKFAEDVKLYAAKEKSVPKIDVFRNADREWNRVATIPLRSKNSIFLPDGVIDNILSYIEEWENRREWAEQRGLPTHTGVMLYGPPGTSKTSLIHAIASETRRDILMLNLSSLASERDLLTIIASKSDYSKAIVAIEDIDASTADVKDRSAAEDNVEKAISLSTLLNMLDGITTPKNMLVIATTNHIEDIDPALLRPGRFDLTVEIGRIGIHEFRRMVAYFDLNPSDYTLDYFHPMTGAEARTLLITGGVKAVVDYQLKIEHGTKGIEL